MALVKVNAAEAYGVNRAFDRALKRALALDDLGEVRVLLQEGYHTRILLSSARHYGIAIGEPYTPPSLFKLCNVAELSAQDDALPVGRPNYVYSMVAGFVAPKPSSNRRVYSCAYDGAG